MTGSGNTMQAAYAGLLAASNAVVNRQLSRGGWSGASSLPSRLRPSTIHDLPRLIDGSDPAHRLPRATAVALLKSLERESKRPYVAPGGPAGPLISEAERTRLARSSNIDVGRACRYCSMFEELFHGRDVPLAVVNHGATIQTSFDDQTGISRAAIADYQILVPQSFAGLAINRNHPLFWAEAAPEFFDATGPAEELSPRPHLRFRLAEELLNDAEAVYGWENEAKEAAIMCERARFPFNENISTRVDNAIRIANFADGTVSHSKEAHQNALKGESKESITERIARKLGKESKFLRDGKPQAPDKWPDGEDRVQRYDFSLELCMRSSYGIGWEDYNGLDIDDGSVNAIAIRYSRILPEHVANLRPQDLRHLATTLARHESAKKAAEAIEEFADQSKNADPKARAELNAEAVKLAGAALEVAWAGKAPWLLAISSSKRLRYALPTVNPVELWSAMTWMAPALLFTFMNRAVCQLPHLLIDEAHASAKDPP